MRLPQRLEALLRQIPQEGLSVADVGTGHGLLAAALARREPGTRVIATEVAAGPWSEAKRSLEASESGRVDLRLGWGLDPLAPGEVDVLVLAGIGGETICAILVAGSAVARSVRRLILQPQNHPERVRRWLLSNDFSLVGEELAVQRGRFHPICVGVPGASADGLALGPAREGETPEAAVERFALAQGLPAGPGELLLELGPLLAAARHPALRELLGRRLAEGRTVSARLRRGAPHTTGRRVQEVEARLAWLEGMLAWLSPSAQS